MTETRQKRLYSIAAILIGCCLFAIPNSAAACPTGSLEPTLQWVTIDGTPAPVQAGSPLPDFEPQERPMLSLAGVWKKQRLDLDHNLSFSVRNAETIALIEGEGGGRHLPEYYDEGWLTKELPGVEARMPGDETAPPEPFHGGVWYRGTVTVPAEWEGRVNRLKFLGVNYITDVWINGDYVGVHEGGYTPFAFEVTDLLIYGEENLIALRIDKPFPGARQDAAPSWFLMDWWDYAGVIQDFYLESALPVHVVRTDVIPRDYNGALQVRTVVANDAEDDLEIEVAIAPYHADADSVAYLTDPRPAAILGEPAYLEGKRKQTIEMAAHSVRVLTFDVRVIAPRRWTPAEPNLYVMKTTATIGNQQDAHHTQFGIRTVARADGRVLLNGRVAFLPGVARHEEWPYSGRTATFDRIVDDLQLVKSLNALFLRTGHYPNHPYTYLVADRLGLAVMTEIPVYWFMFWNWDAQEERRIADQMFREMILQGLNRPSILFWGTENECPFLFADQMLSYNQRLAEDVRTHINDGRLLMQSPAADFGWQAIMKTNNPLDVAGWTMYYGVFYGKEYYQDTLDFILENQSMRPGYPLIATEFGIWSEADGSNEAGQVTVFDETFRAFTETAALDAQGNVNPDGHLAATTWFCIFDWFTKNGFPEFIAPFHQSMGLIHMDRQTWKPAALALQTAYAPYAAFGGLGPEPNDYVDEPEAPADDDDDDDDADDWIPPWENNDDDDEDDEELCCGLL